jgi:pimeloyl-ACP methyl ester carboxylesterase
MRDEAGLEIAVIGHGTGVPVALLHEGLGSVAMWRDFPEKLARRINRRVILWSRRGYGHSDAFDAPYGRDFMHREADAAAQTLRRHGFDRAHFLGHSDGASIALLLASRHPELVASLMLEAPHVFVEPVCTAAIRRLVQGADVGALLGRMGKYHRDPAAVFRQWSAIWLDQEFTHWNIEEEINRIRCPILLVQGEDDEYGTFAQIERISMRAPQALELRLAQCGHSPHRDQEAAVLSALAEFLERASSD